MGDIAAIVAAVIVVLVALVTLRSVRIVPQARARNVERLGRYRKTLEPGMNLIIPFVDRVKPLIDLREQVVSFTGQRVITEDNLVVSIDTVLFFQVTDPRAADYEIVNYIQAIEQLTATMLRSVIGSMDLEQTLTSRDKINTLLRGVLDDASGKWGIRVTRVEIKTIDPPQSVKDAMEKQMKAEREKRAAILNAEGVRQSQILTADGEKQGSILRAEGEKQSAILKAEGQAQAITSVFQSIHDNDPDPKLLAYQYLQTLPQIAQGPGNTVWMVPSELTSALKAVSGAFGAEIEAKNKVPGTSGLPRALPAELSDRERATSQPAAVTDSAAAGVTLPEAIAAGTEASAPGAVPAAAMSAEVPAVGAVLAGAAVSGAAVSEAALAGFEADGEGLPAAARALGRPEPPGATDGQGGAANGNASAAG